MMGGLLGTVCRIGLDHAVIGAGPFDLKVAMPLSAPTTLPPVGSPVDLGT